MHEAKTHLSRHVAELEPGDRLILCNRNRPVAEVRALPRAKAPRRLGLATGDFQVGDAFLAPLPDEILEAFET